MKAYKEAVQEIIGIAEKGRTMIWAISGPNLPTLKIRADSFDEALAKARMMDKNYCGGYVADDE